MLVIEYKLLMMIMMMMVVVIIYITYIINFILLLEFGSSGTPLFNSQNINLERE
jgi:hypothetical protein